MINEEDIVSDKDFIKRVITSADISELDFSVRTYNGLKKAGINTIGELCQNSYEDLENNEHLNKKPVEEIYKKLKSIGLSLKVPNYRIATKDDWKRLPLPLTSIHFPIVLPLKEHEVDKLKRGFVPFDMDCKWFFYFEDGKLHFYRSWSGKCYFIVALGENNVRHTVTAFVYDDEDMNKKVDDARHLIVDLLRNFARTPYYNYG